MHGETRSSLGMRRTEKYVGVTKDEAQRSRWTFCEAVKIVGGNHATHHYRVVSYCSRNLGHL
jgi:hypothetical protein